MLMKLKKWQKIFKKLEKFKKIMVASPISTEINKQILVKIGLVTLHLKLTASDARIR
jgi:hypothetical protein